MGRWERGTEAGAPAPEPLNGGGRRSAREAQSCERRRARAEAGVKGRGRSGDSHDAAVDRPAAGGACPGLGLGDGTEALSGGSRGDQVFPLILTQKLGGQVNLETVGRVPVHADILETEKSRGVFTVRKEKPVPEILDSGVSCVRRREQRACRWWRRRKPVPYHQGPWF